MSLGNITICRGILVVFAAAGILAGTSSLAAASAHTTPASSSLLVSAHVTVMSPKATLAYWTPARLRAAKPADIITVRSNASAPQAPASPTGRPGSVPGGLPADSGAAVAAHPTAALTPALSNNYNYPFPYTISQVPASSYTKYPWDLNGKLFFSNAGGNYVCSATSVGSASGTKDENEIWTAGHCAANTAGTHVWDSSAVFIPAYNGTASDTDPFGEFTWTGAAETTTAWLNNGDFTEDEAAMTVGTSSTTGKTLGQAVGWDGFAWNKPVTENFTAFGYPAASPYNGLTMYQDSAPTGTQDTGISGANATKPIGIGNPMTGGSSGGAWNIDWTTSNPGYINGHNDYKYSTQPLAMYSPYQDTLSNTVRCFGASSC